MTPRRLTFLLDQTRDLLAEAQAGARVIDASFSTDPSAYYRAGLRDLLSATLLHLLHQVGNAGLTVEAARNSIRCEHAAAFDAFQRLVKGGLAHPPQRQTGRGRPYAWTITPHGSEVVTTPPLRCANIQPVLIP